MTANVKESAIKLIEDLPDDVSLEDIMYELYFKSQVDEGLKQIEAGLTVSHDEVKRSLADWLKSAGR